MGSLTCFGTGDGVAISDRNHSAYLYTFGTTNLLIDCGEPISRLLKKAGVSVDTIDHLIISHLHADHFGGLFMLLQGFWIDQRRKPLVVHMPGDAIAPIRQMLQAGYLFAENLQFQLNFSALPPRQPMELGAMRVTPYPTTHLERLRQKFQSKYPGEYQAYAFLLEAQGVKAGHSADLGAPEDLEPLLAEPLDLLVCELAHAKPEVMFNYLKGREIRRILFTHIARYEWEHMEEVRRKANDILQGMQFSFAGDGELVSL